MANPIGISKNSIKSIPPSRTAYGILIDNNGAEIKFYQPCATELGLSVGTVVQYSIYVNPSTHERIAYNVGVTVNPQKNGIVIILDNDEGTITDPVYGTISAYEPLMSQQGITNGASIKYQLVQTAQGMIAVYIKLP